MTDDLPAEDIPQPSKLQQRIAARRAAEDARRQATVSPWVAYAEAHPESVPEVESASGDRRPETDRVNELWEDMGLLHDSVTVG